MTKRAILTRVVILASCFLCATLTTLVPASAQPASASGSGLAAGQNWPVVGQSILDDRYQPGETQINPANVGELKPKWVFTATTDVQDTPTVADGVAYFTDFGGYLYAVNADTGALIWKNQISNYTGNANANSRSSPAISGDELILGDTGNYGTAQPGANVFAVNRWTGKLIWKTRVESQAASIITASPVAYGDSVYVGVSSIEEGLVVLPSYPCCTFRGSVVSLNVHTGHINWQFYTIPASLDTGCSATDCGYAGAAVWSTTAIDPRLNALYVGTGNNYTVPKSVQQCAAEAQKNGTSDDNCSAPTDYQESVLSLNLSNGALNWAHRVSGYDASIAACPSQPVPWCPSPYGADADFGSGPNVYTTMVNGQPTTVVGVGQKSGVYWAFDATNGSLIWSTLVGPGGTDGGIIRGTATDGQQIYAPISNTGRTPYILQPSGRTDTGGSWSALNARTGKIVWQTADPGRTVPFDNAPPTVADGVVYVGSQQPTGPNMYALDAQTGKILWRFASGGSVGSGPAVVGGTVFWGSGYSVGAEFGDTGNNVLYAFTLKGR
jgi:polyvinyl alcohol dehydrogenase (cytochrome)